MKSCGKMMAAPLAMFILYVYMNTSLIQVSEKEERPEKRLYAVNSPSCKIPALEPFEDSVNKYFRVVKSKICSERRDLAHQKGNMLMLNLTTAKNFCQGNFAHCEYSSIIRLNDNNIKYVPAIKFKGNTIVTSEFIRVKCHCANNTKIYTNLHAFVHALNKGKNSTKVSKKIKATMLKPPDKEPKILNKTRLNVIMLGVDSVSRLNSHRQLSATRNFLLGTLGGIELKGYNKVADNTFVNIIPLLFGKYIKEMPWTRRVKKTFDQYDLMWSKYHRQGYKTLYAEDHPRIVAFNGLKRGFSKPPTDHYLRPMSVAMEKEKSVWWSNHHCMNGRLEVQFVMQYISDFANVYRSDSYFSFSFLSRLSHDDINLVGSADYAFEEFYRKLHNEQLLNDTLLIFFSDHGMRFGKFRETLQGKLEERLPMMYIVPPKWLPERYPRLWKNLKTNGERLTTPFDIHETLLSAMDLKKFQENLSKMDLNRRGISLFAEVPHNRTCKSATILPHWCTCQTGKKIPLNDKTAVKVAGLIVAQINQLLKPGKSKCASLKLDKVEQVTVIVPNDKLLAYVDCKDQVEDTRGVKYGKVTQISNLVYQMTLRTKPGSALFETTVKYEAKHNRIEMLGDISRTNKYGKQSNCTSNQEIQKYCYCK